MNIIESKEIPIYVNVNENYAFSYITNEYLNTKRKLIFRKGNLDYLKENPQLISQNENEILYLQDIKQLAIIYNEILYLLPTRIIENEERKPDPVENNTIKSNIFSKIKNRIFRI